MKRARRGNSKNLQSQASQDENKSDGRRKLRSAKSGVAEQVESSDVAKTKRKNINLTRFLYKNKEDRPESLLQKAEHDSDDFETPVKKIKRAPKLSQPTITNRNGTTKKGNNVRPKAKRQQKITTAFLRSEQMFSEVAAQHALADNLNPDDVQLALALSRSQLETNIVNSQESAVSADNVKIINPPTEESIRSKLQKFGYRTGNKEAYSHDFLEAFLTNQRRTKTKWANKFTALTLRNPKIQNRKLNANIDAILQRQFETKPTEDCSIIEKPYQMQSTMLNQYAVIDKEALRFRNAEMLSTTENLDRYFVTELFPVTHLPAGHLLKDWATIAGRDRSPERDKGKGLDSQAIKRKYEHFYKELETIFSKKRTNTPQDKKEIMSQEQEIVLKAPIEASSLSQVDERRRTLSIIQNSSETVSTQASTVLEFARVLSPIYLEEEIVNEIPSTEMDDSMHNQNFLDDEKSISKSQESQKNKESTPIVKTSKVDSLETSIKNTEKPLDDEYSINEQNGCSSEMLADVLVLRNGAEDCLNIKTQTRPTSPDLFADSDSDCAADAVESNKLTDIITYEVYSSDDVKTSCEVSYRPELLSVKADNVVDLTQRSDELKSPKLKKQNISKRLDFLDIPKESEICSISDGKNDILEKEHIEPFNYSTIANVDLTQSDDSSNDTIKELKDSLCNRTKNTTKDKVERLPIAHASQNRMSPTVEDNDLKTFSNKFSIYDDENVSLPNEPSFSSELGIEPLNDSIDNIDLTQSSHDCDNAFNEFEDCFSNKSRHKSMNRMERLSIAYDNQNRMSPVIEENDFEMFSDKSWIYDKEKVPPNEPSFYDEPGIKPLNDSIDDIDLTQSDHDDDDDVCIMLSDDDEVNYSIKKANRTLIKPELSSSQSSLSSSSSSSEESCNNAEINANACIMLSDDDEVNYSIKNANRPERSSSKSLLLKSINKSTISKCFNESDEDYEELENRFRNVVEYNFSVLDLIDVEKSFRVTEQNDEIFPKNASFDLSGDIEPILKECLSTQQHVTRDCRETPTKKEESTSISEMLKKERAEFGILESQSETFSPKHWMRTPVKEKTPPRNVDAYQIQSFSIEGKNSRNYQNVRTTPERPSSDVFPMEFNDFDEFDRMVYGSPTKNVLETQAQRNVPAGLSQLLTAEISFNARSATVATPPRKCQPPSQSKSQSKSSSSSPSLSLSLAMVVERTPEKSKDHRSMAIGGVITPVRRKQQTSLPIGGIISPEKAKEFTYDEEEITINDHVYIVRRTDSPEPNFSAQSDDELLKQLANFGIKPLKRNLAIKFLKYIYDETHPIIETEPNENAQMSEEIVCNKKTSTKGKKGSKPQIQNQTKKFDLEDCTGDKLLRYTAELCAELRNDEEVYIFQTNVRKNTQHPLLPLHIAWFNLVCSSEVLHESMLMYEAIDLQEIFLFFKSIGYRYDPKQLKSFFDRRCIIFRYDLNPVEKPGNRYARNPHKKTTKATNSQKSASSQIIKNSQKPTDAEQTEKSARPQKMRKFKKYTSSQRSKKLPSSQPTLQKYLSL